MINKYILSASIYIFTSILVIAQNKTSDIRVEITGMLSDKGATFVALYDSEQTFLKKLFKGEISKIENKKSVIVFKNIPIGVYAISVFHDENNNKKLDTNFLGIPKEPTGCSNNAQGFMGPPKFKDAKFLLDKNRTIAIKVQ